MGNRLRHSEPRQIVEVSARCFQGRFLLEQSDPTTLNHRFIGVWAKTQEDFDIEVYFLVTMSNHFHALISGPNQVEISRFMNVVQSGTAREINRLIGWKGSFWHERYNQSPVLEERAALQRLQYLISNSVKEGLVAHPDDWLLVHSARALAGNMTLEGEWVDRTRMNRRRGKDQAEFTEKVTLKLSRLPMFEGLRPTRFKKAMKEFIDDVVTGKAKVFHRRAAKKRIERAMRRRCRHHRPEKVEWSPAPVCHSVSDRARKAFEASYRVFVQMYREASARLQESMGALGYPTYSQVMALALTA